MNSKPLLITHVQMSSVNATTWIDVRTRDLSGSTVRAIRCAMLRAEKEVTLPNGVRYQW